HRLGWEAAAASPEPATEGEGPPRKLTHRTIQGVTADVDRCKFNTAVSKLMTLTTGAAHELEAGGDARAAREALEAIARMVAPMAPHIAEELWREAFGHGESVFVSGWPAFDAELAHQEDV